MLLQTLRQSRALARWVLVWFALAMGVAVAAPVMQPLQLSTVCSTAVADASGDSVPDGLAASSHHGLQCVLCLGFGAPPQSLWQAPLLPVAADSTLAIRPEAVALAPRLSPLVARAPPQR